MLFGRTRMVEYYSEVKGDSGVSQIYVDNK